MHYSRLIVQKLQDQVEAGAEQVELLRAVERDEVDHVRLILTLTHERADHLFELGQVLVEDG